MDWPGKKDCMKLIQQPSVATLKPCRDESVDFDTTENLFIEGDNLEVLKLLQKSYYGKVKMIYIDPPYNTGKEFIYPDKYSETLETYLAYAGLVDDEGKKFSTNTPNEGRFHTRWLNMMYPRLYLARSLLREDGVIFISIDDNELNNLRKMCDEIFGEENFIAQITWEKTRKNDAKLFSIGHEYIVIYARNHGYLKETGTIWREQKPGAKEIIVKYSELKAKYDKQYDKIEEGLREWYNSLPDRHPSKKLNRYKHVDKWGPWRDRDISWPGGGGPRYDVIHPKTGKPCAVPERGWGFSTPESMQKQIDLGLVVFREDHTKPPIRKAHLVPILEELDDERFDGMDVNIDEDVSEDEENVGLQVMPSVLYKQAQVSIKYLRKLMGNKVFDNPKDHEILARIIKYCTSDGDIVLDFFAGSCPIAEAVFDLNYENTAKRKFILVQLPEPTPEKSIAKQAGFCTISDLGKERTRRAIKKIEKVLEDELQAQKGILPEMAEDLPVLDLGFKVFKLDRSNFKIWDGSKPDAPEEELIRQLTLHIDHIDPHASQEDILYELLLKAGFVLTEKVQKLEMAGKTVYSAAEGALLICLEDKITPELVDAVAAAEPMQFLCLDKGFQGNDQLKANAVQTFNALNQGRDKTEQIVFRTV